MFPVALSSLALLVSLFAAAPQMSDQDTIRAIARDFTAGFNQDNVDLIMRHYAESYVDMNLSNPVRSKADQYSYYKAITSRHDTRIEVLPDEIKVEGAMAAVRGRIMLSKKKDGNWGAPAELRYVEVLRKDASGQWKVIWGMDAEVYPESRQEAR